MKILRILKSELFEAMNEFISHKGGIPYVGHKQQAEIKDMRRLFDMTDQEGFDFAQASEFCTRVFKYIKGMDDSFLAILGFKRKDSLRQRLLAVVRLEKFQSAAIQASLLAEASEAVARLKFAGGGDWYDISETLKDKLERVDKQMGLMSSQYSSMQVMFRGVIERNQALQDENTELKREVALLREQKAEDDQAIAALQASIVELSAQSREEVSEPLIEWDNVSLDSLVQHADLAKGGDAAVVGH